MKYVGIINTQAAGDCMLGSHTAKLYKQKFPDSHITFFVRQGLVPTTGESDLNDGIIFKLLNMQDGIDAVGFLRHDGSLVSSDPNIQKLDEIIEQRAWFSDLGIALSQHYSVVTKYGQEGFTDTETQFIVGSEKQLPTDKLVISTSGPLDWNRKTKNESLRLDILRRLYKYLTDNNIAAEIQMLGRDVEPEDLIVSLQRLNNSHIYIGPMGLPVHMAAGLQVDTIHITSVFPALYDSPAYYHSGWHRPIKSKIHCGTYACVSEKTFSTQVYAAEGPNAAYGFWPKICPHTDNKMSCVYNTQSEQVIQAFDEWYTEKGKYLCNQ
jgi:hypothetical protein